MNFTIINNWPRFHRCNRILNAAAMVPLENDQQQLCYWSGWTLIWIYFERLNCYVIIKIFKYSLDKLELCMQVALASLEIRNNWIQMSTR